MKKKKLSSYIVVFMILALSLSCCKKTSWAAAGGIKVISLAPSITRMIYELGAEEMLAGVTDICEYGGRVERSVKAGRLLRVSDFNSFNYEKIMMIDPDMVIGMDSVPYTAKTYMEKLFGKDKIRWLMHPKNIEGVTEQILTVGKMLDKNEKALEAVRSMKAKLADIENNVKNIPLSERKTILVEIYYPPFTSAGKNTFVNDIIVKAGCVPLFDHKEDWPVISTEEIMLKDPDFILKTHQGFTHKGLLLIKAYKENRVIIPDDIDIFLQPGSASVDAAEELYKKVYGRSVN